MKALGINVRLLEERNKKNTAWKSVVQKSIENPIGELVCCMKWVKLQLKSNFLFDGFSGWVIKLSLIYNRIGT